MQCYMCVLLFLQQSYLFTLECLAKCLMHSVCVLCCTVLSDSFWPHGPPDPIRLLCPWNCLGNNSGVGCHFLLQGTFPTQGLNSCLPFSSCPRSFPAPGSFLFFFFFSFFSDSLHQVAKYWSFSVSPSSEYAELISFRIDWFDFLAVQEMIVDTVYPKYLPKNVSYVFFFGISQSSYMR